MRAMWIVEDKLRAMQADMGVLGDGESIVLQFLVKCVEPMLESNGLLVVTNMNVFFQEFVPLCANPCPILSLSNIRRVLTRRYLLRQVGLEIYTETTSYLYAFKTLKQRDELFNTLTSLPLCKKNLEPTDMSNMTLKWQSGIASNYEYLMYLNSIADRSFNDLTQYPVFPWVLNDYSSESIDLEDPSIYRDLSKPVGALNPQRLQMFRQRFEQMDGDHKFMYGTHYSTPAFVLYWLVRVVPDYQLKLHRGRFDVADRMFFSVAHAWDSALNNTADVKELIPEFYSPGSFEFLLNSNHLDLGERHNHESVDDVQLPPWAPSPSEFLSTMRAALESDFVSQNLHNWIDLVFGYKQRGEAAKVADNVFYHLTYEGAVDMENQPDPLVRHGLQRQIQEFGQTPKQLFIQPHPVKFGLQKIAPILPHIPSTSSIQSTESFPSLSNDWSFQSLQALQPSGEKPLKIHRSAVTSLAATADEEKLLSVAQDGLLKIHSLATSAQLRSFNVGDLALSSLCVTEDASSVVLGCWDNHVYQYSIDYGRIQQRFRAHDEAVTCLRLEERCGMMASGSWDSSVKVWGYTPTGFNTIPLNDFYEADTEVLCLDSQLTMGLCAAGSRDGRVYLFDIRSNKCVHSMHAHSQKVTGVQFVNNGRQVATCSSDGVVKLFEMGGGEVMSVSVNVPIKCMKTDGLHVVVGDEQGYLRLLGLEQDPLAQRIWVHKIHSQPITSVEVALNGSVIFVGTDDGFLHTLRESSANSPPVHHHTATRFSHMNKLHISNVAEKKDVRKSPRPTRSSEEPKKSNEEETANNNGSRKSSNVPTVVAVTSCLSWGDE
eukprot:c7760_g1_i2.p1 GENE.c7760_g1_i2~~c7760_g1_i2.p1  ORF type:complete len:961 (-),score=246.06 c7760_g1_i2:23-2503(-)